DMTDEELLARGWTAAVRDASFDVARGEVFVIMGLSGSGKSTVVRCLSRLIEPTSGEVNVEGQDLLAASEAKLLKIRRQKMGMVFQHFALLPNRDVLGNVAFPLQVQDVARSQREERAREMISLVGLEGRENFFPGELSGGQQQRGGIARSLASDPAIWFLDEPFSALDPLIRADLQDELLRLQDQLHKTTVFITHDLDESIKIADRIAIMDQGRIVQIGSPEELVLNPANDYVARFVKNVPRSKVVRVSNIIRSATSADVVGDWVVNINDRLADVAPRIGGSTQPIAVQDDGGVTVGYVDRDKFVRILAGSA
ncbi:MAG: betaine/proline/choline family ABC transporter ATP-binding protein, partial [Proteobacteria bacterium]|nr:betaine/proline/choline family ABC transporter ATP-binding protein [Pseudomonadota bacterium]